MEDVNQKHITVDTKKQKKNLFSLLTKKKGKKTYPKNRTGMRAAMHDTGALYGHTRKSAARARVHKPTAEELAVWVEWKAEQREKKGRQ